MSATMKIDSETCTKCSLCSSICPALAILQEKGELPIRNPARETLCVECGQCMAVCPSQSITIGDLSYTKDFIELSKDHIDFPAFMNFAASRRSIRNFKDKPVPRELLEKIVAGITQAPMGFPPHKTCITVVQDRATVEQMLPLMVDFYDKMTGWLKNPFMRFFIKRNVGPEMFTTIIHHLQPIIKIKIPDMKKGGRDEISRGAPALILFHAPRLAESHTQDANIALTYGLLAAHSLGLGATAIMLIPPAVNKTPALQKMLQLPPDHEVVISMIVGYPKYKYQRGIRRELAGVNWI